MGILLKAYANYHNIFLKKKDKRLMLHEAYLMYLYIKQT